MKIKGLDKVYIIHYAKLHDRREYISKKIKELNMGDIVEWNIAPENEVLSKKDLAFYDSSDAARAERLKVLGNVFEDPKKLLNKGAIAVTLQHFRTIKKIADKKSHNASMIIEDDALFEEDFLSKLEKLIKKLNTVKWDICYTDKGGLISPIKQSSNKDELDLYKPKNRFGNTTGSYLVNPQSAKKISRLMKKFNLASDTELSYIQKKYKLKVYWSVPFLTKQGTIEGIYASNIREESKTMKINRLLNRIKNKNPRIAKILSYMLQKLQNLKYVIGVDKL